MALLGDHRSVSKSTVWIGGATDALQLHLDEQEATIDKRWEWMVRIVDAGRAIAERGFPLDVHAEVHLTIDDDVLPRNAGRFVLSVADGRGELRPGGTGRLRTHVRGLAAVYTSHLTAHEAARAGLMGGTDDDLARLSACFAGPAPWMSDFF